jgi:hypothetical protein
MAFESLADVPCELLSTLRFLAGYVASYLAVRLNRLPFQAGQHSRTPTDALDQMGQPAAKDLRSPLHPRTSDYP